MLNAGSKVGRYCQSGGIVRTLFWILIVLLGTRTALAQQPQPTEQSSSASGQTKPQEQSEQNANPENPDNRPDLPRTEEQVETSPPHEEPAVSSLDTGQVIEHGVSSVHLGRLSLFSVNASFLYDDLNSGNNTQILRTGFVRGFVVYSLKHGSSGIDFQYLPQVVFSNLGANSNLGNQASNFHTFIRLASHWSFDLNDYFVYQPNSGFVPEATLIPIFPTGGAQQNPFLAADQKYLSNLAQPTLNYDLNARDRFTFLGKYEFLHVSTFVTPPNSPKAPPNTTVTGEDNMAGGGMGWTHNWNPTDSMSLIGEYDRRFYATGGASNYYLVTIAARKRLRPGLFVSASIGPSYQTQNIPTSTGNRTTRTSTYEGSFILTKSFRRSGFAISYDRDHTASQYLTGTLTDRYGVSYNLGLGSRWNVGAGIGFMRQEFAVNGVNLRPYDGRTGWANLSFQIAREWSLYTNYLRFTDTGLFTFAPAIRNIGTAGIRWAWQPKEHAAAPARVGVL